MSGSIRSLICACFGNDRERFASAETSAAVKVLVTGATGMLGRSVMRLLEREPKAYTIVGTGFRRAAPPLRKLDLTDTDAAELLFDEVQPDFVVHCAAERDPDRADADPGGVIKLNVDACVRLARLCTKHRATIIYMSTDYVFDGGLKYGVGPPYGVDAKTAPCNFYGQSKLDGEKAILGEGGASAVVLRVPVLYGKDCKDVSESASLSVAKSLLEKGKKDVDDWGVRFPTCVDDVAEVIKGLLDVKAKDRSRASGVLHCSSPESTTKYEMCVMMADILHMKADHLRPDPNPPAGAPRPKNTQLDCSETWKQLGWTHKFPSLRHGLSDALQTFAAEHQK